MQGHFLFALDLEKEQLDWGERKWFSLPKLTSTKSLVVVEVNLQPGFGHNFHLHPRQEEIAFVLDGEIEQWLEEEKTILKAGDSAFIPANVIHASFNVSDRAVRVLAILGPAIGAEGYEVIEVADKTPWNAIRNP